MINGWFRVFTMVFAGTGIAFLCSCNDEDSNLIYAVGVLDPSSGLYWENPLTGGSRSWSSAIEYCNNLGLEGHGSGLWYLPSISELRSFVRGCSSNETDGDCGVNDSCLGSECRDYRCYGCPGMEGPGTDGLYWPEGFDHSSGRGWWYWSSSTYADSDSSAWGIYFNDSSIQIADKSHTGRFRCVHREP